MSLKVVEKYLWYEELEDYSLKNCIAFLSTSKGGMGLGAETVEFLLLEKDILYILVTNKNCMNVGRYLSLVFRFIYKNDIHNVLRVWQEKEFSKVLTFVRYPLGKDVFENIADNTDVDIHHYIVESLKTEYEKSNRIITGIGTRWLSGAMCRDTDLSKHELEVNLKNNKLVVKKGSYKDSNFVRYEVYIEPQKAKECFSQLLDITEEWIDEYVDECACDCPRWDITLTYLDGEIRKIHGNIPPWRYKEFDNIVKSLVDEYEIDFHIF